MPRSKVVEVNTIETFEEQLQKLLSALKGEKIHKIIVFGSVANGHIHEDSDLDLLIVLDTDYLPTTYEERMEYRLQIQRKVRDVRKRIPVDLLIYTRPEYEMITEDMSSFMKEIHESGKVINEKAG